MTTLWLIRHGETDWNIQLRFQGISDRPLNQTGKKQATSLVPRLTGMSFDAIYCSDLKRVQQTAGFALDDAIDSMILDARLREFDFGAWEGKKWDDISEKYPDEYQSWQQDRENIPHGGERLSEVTARIQSFLDELRQKHNDDAHILIFAHGGSLGVLMSLLMGNDPNRWWQYRLFNCTLNEMLIFNRGAVLTRLNDDIHLPDDE